MNVHVEKRAIVWSFPVAILLAACCMPAGCQVQSAVPDHRHDGPGAAQLLDDDGRSGGQMEAYAVADGKLQRFGAQAPADRTSVVDPGDGEAIRSSDDVVAIQVESACLNDLPSHLAGSNDAIVFVDVWENATAGYNSPSTTSIVYLGKNQPPPGRLGLRDVLAYGPTKYKGHPLRIRFSMMVFAKKPGVEESSTIDVINACSINGGSDSAKALQAVLRTRKDVIVRDFETTLLSAQPQGMAPTTQPASVASDQAPWLRYGRFVLLESGSNEGMKSVSPQQITLDDGWLRLPAKGGQTIGDPLTANYLVVRITPHQLPDDDEIMRAVAAANRDAFNSVQRSDGETAAAVAGILSGAQTLSDEILRIKAEKLARMQAVQAMRIAEPAKRNEALADLFNDEWNKIVSALPDTRQVPAAKAGAVALSRWQAKLDASNSPPPSDPLALQITRDQLRVKLLADAGVPIAQRTFTITSAKIEKDETNRYTVLEVGLAPTPTDNNTSVSKTALWAVICGKANGVLVDQTGALPGTTAITTVKLDAASAAALATTLTTP